MVVKRGQGGAKGVPLIPLRPSSSPFRPDPFGDWALVFFLLISFLFFILLCKRINTVEISGVTKVFNVLEGRQFIRPSFS